MKRVLKIKTYQVPFRINPEGKAEVDNTQPLSEEDLVGEEEREIEDISTELPNLSREIGQFNQRQLVYAERGLIVEDYIHRKIITK